MKFALAKRCGNTTGFYRTLKSIVLSMRKHTKMAWSQRKQTTLFKRKRTKNTSKMLNLVLTDQKYCHMLPHSFTHSAIPGINKTLSGIIAVSLDDTAEIRLIKPINPEHGSKASDMETESRAKDGKRCQEICKGPTSPARLASLEC